MSVKKTYPLVLVLVIFMSAVSHSVIITTTKLAYVNLEKVFGKSSEIIKARGEIRNTFEKRKAEIAGLENEISVIKNRVEDQEESFLPEDRESFESIIKLKEEEIKMLMKESREFVISQEEEFKKKIMGNIYDAVLDIAETGNYTVILDRDSVIYSEDSVIDITGEVIEHLNRSGK